MPHAQAAAARLCTLLLLLLGASLTAANSEESGSNSISDEAEVELKWDELGPVEDRHYGLNILDSRGEVILSDPTDQVLRAVVKSGDPHYPLDLHKLKAITRRLREDGDKVQETDQPMDGLDKKKQSDGRDEPVLSRLVKWIWE